MLALLFGLEPEPCQPAEILSRNSLVDSGTAADALSVVVRNVCPPICLCLDVAQNHVLDRRRQPRHLPGDVCLPTVVCNNKRAQQEVRLLLGCVLQLETKVFPVSDRSDGERQIRLLLVYDRIEWFEHTGKGCDVPNKSDLHSARRAVGCRFASFSFQSERPCNFAESLENAVVHLRA